MQVASQAPRCVLGGALINPLPRLCCLQGGVMCVAKVAASESVFTVSEASSENDPGDVGVILGHAIDLVSE